MSVTDREQSGHQSTLMIDGNVERILCTDLNDINGYLWSGKPK